MRRSAFTLALSALTFGQFSTGVLAQDRLSLTPARLPGVAAELLAADDVAQQDVQRPRSVKSGFYLIRLYQIPEIGGCEGTDETCLQRCALLVGTGGMPGAFALFDLGVVGEITAIEWVSSPPPRVLSQNPPVLAYTADATLSVTVQNYPSGILARHPDLTRRVKRYQLKVTMDSVAVTLVP
jgi:hypothetical protein